jgi:hypothetical protein
MTNLYLGRPYGQYSTFIMLNTTVDQVNPTGWIEFSGDTNLPTSTYAEFNTMGPGGLTVSQRETISLRPESLTAAQAAQCTLDVPRHTHSRLMGSDAGAYGRS